MCACVLFRKKEKILGKVSKGKGLSFGKDEPPITHTMCVRFLGRVLSFVCVSVCACDCAAQNFILLLPQGVGAPQWPC
jgi:hypothetical protein